MRLVPHPLLALLLAATGVVATQLPAAAAYTTTIDGVDSSVAGHVTGTVTTDAPAVRLELRESDGSGATVVELTPVDGAAPFDVETWGFDTALLAATPCGVDGGGLLDPATCETEVASTPFAVTDVAPTVTWPADLTIGPADTPQVAVTDSGGGTLDVVFTGSDGTQTDPVTNPDGTPQAIDLPDGTWTGVVVRCATAGTPCRTTDAAGTSLAVETIFTATTVPGLTRSTADPDIYLGSVAIDTATLTDPATTGPFSVHWLLRKHDGVAVASGTSAGLTLDANDQIHPEISFAGRGDTSFWVELEVALDSPDHGTVPATPVATQDFVLDTTAPGIRAVALSSTSVYPYRDGYRDSVGLTLTPWSLDPDDTARVVVRNSNGTVVRTLAPTKVASLKYYFTWNGRTAAGVAVPAGSYTVNVSLADDRGNVKTVAPRTVTVVRKKLSNREFRKTVTASGSTFDRYVGRCSTLKYPSNRGWTGSHGLYSNTKCDTDVWDDSIVETFNAVRVPAALKYGDFRITVYGGAATSAKSSIMGFSYINADLDFTHDTFFGGTLGYHAGELANANTHLVEGKYLVWSPYTALGDRYDIKNYTVKLKYTVLVADS